MYQVKITFDNGAIQEYSGNRERITMILWHLGIEPHMLKAAWRAQSTQLTAKENVTVLLSKYTPVAPSANSRELTLDAYNGTRGTGLRFRTPNSVAELIAHCSTHNHIWIHGNQGDARQVKVNGAVRTWKRDPSRVEIPVKYGLYEYHTMDAREGMERVLIPIE